MDEELEAALMRAGQQIEQLQRQCEVLRAERDQARARVDNAVNLLTGIHSCMYPSAVKMEDGRLMVFRPENPHEYLQALSDRIRSLPDEMVARGAGVVVAAWGAHGTYKGRDQSVRLMVPDLHYLRLTKDGHPGHPLYLPADLKPQRWVQW